MQTIASEILAVPNVERRRPPIPNGGLSSDHPSSSQRPRTTVWGKGEGGRRRIPEASAAPAVVVVVFVVLAVGPAIARTVPYHASAVHPAVVHAAAHHTASHGALCAAHPARRGRHDSRYTDDADAEQGRRYKAHHDADLHSSPPWGSMEMKRP